MGKDAHRYVKERESRMCAKQPFSASGVLRDYLHESSTSQLPREITTQRGYYNDLFKQGYVPAASLLSEGVDLSGCPVKRVALPKKNIPGVVDTLVQETWLPVWVAAILLCKLPRWGSLSSAEVCSRIERALSDVEQQVIECGTALLVERSSDPNVQRALRIWIAKSVKKTRGKG